MIDHSETDARLIMELMFKLQLIPLTKQLTAICGNLWIRSLQNQRAERNEMLLMHEFYQRDFIFPDKYRMKNNKIEEEMENEDLDGINPGNEPAEGGNKGGKKREKKKYAGGLVLQPKSKLFTRSLPASTRPAAGTAAVAATATARTAALTDVAPD